MGILECRWVNDTIRCDRCARVWMSIVVVFGDAVGGGRANR